MWGLILPKKCVWNFKVRNQPFEISSKRNFVQRTLFMERCNPNIRYISIKMGQFAKNFIKNFIKQFQRHGKKKFIIFSVFNRDSYYFKFCKKICKKIVFYFGNLKLHSSFMISSENWASNVESSIWSNFEKKQASQLSIITRILFCPVTAEPFDENWQLH